MKPTASVGRNPEGEDPADGRRRNDEHAVGATGAETPNPGSTPETGLVLRLARCLQSAVALIENDRRLYWSQMEAARALVDEARESLSNVSRLED